MELEEAGLSLSANLRPNPGDDRIDLDVGFSMAPGTHAHSSLCFDIEFTRWSESTYVLFPGAAYNGNRFENRRIPYSPKLEDPADIGVDVEPIISDIPRLNIRSGPSRMHPSPGICTYSGLALFSLAHYAGEDAYAGLLREIACQIPQNLSHPDRPVPGLKEGLISERINTSDWLENARSRQANLLLNCGSMAGGRLRPEDVAVLRSLRN